MARRSRAQSARRLYGIGEWYGKLFTNLSIEERKEFAMIQTLARRNRPPQECPFQSTEEEFVECRKDGGVCSLRLYEKDASDNVSAVSSLCTTCPNRFMEDGAVFQWIGETILSRSDIRILGEIGFLERDDPESSASVGRIDNVLVVPGTNPLVWCAVEIQAVYFQGAAMSRDFREIQRLPPGQDPFPAGRRQPDYRSSGPKRLMPQLQIKVPTLRRWGKKMTVVVDRNFFDAMGTIDTVPHISNCDIAWFVVRYNESQDATKLIPDQVYFTTLERSVEGLIAGVPVDLHTFEERILVKLGI